MILQELSKRNKEWLKIALSICKDESLSKELVQEMYLRLNKYINNIDRITVDGKISSLYIYVTIRNLYYKHQNKRKKNIIFQYKDYDSFDDGLNINDNFKSSIDNDIELSNMEEAHKKIMDNILKEVSTWHWYDEKLFKLYFFTDKSLRNIASETKISLTSIYNSCKNYKQILIEKFGEDVTDFFNKDYYQIK
jgi:RNA polymerase sigma factor (sigma-70 family)